MSTRKVKMTGPVYWAKIFEGTRDLTGFEDALKEVGGQTSIDIDLDAANMDKLRRSKSMKKGTESPDNDGYTRVKLTRRWEDRYAGGEPKVEKADGTPWSLEEDGLIGNGSIAEVTISVYDTSRKNIVGTRLEKVKVIDHIVYDPDAETPLDDDEPTPALKQAVVKANTRLAPVDDDSLPF